VFPPPPPGGGVGVGGGVGGGLVGGGGGGGGSRQAMIFLRAAAASVFVGMGLSSAYAVVDYLKSEALTIPRMAGTHGVLNAVGFCMLGLLGWLVQSREQ